MKCNMKNDTMLQFQSILNWGHTNLNNGCMKFIWNTMGCTTRSFIIMGSTANGSLILQELHIQGLQQILLFN